MPEQYREIVPDRRLAAVVDRFWLRTARLPTPACILPDGCLDVLISADEPEGARVVGTMTRARTFVPNGPVDLLAVRFRPGAASAFLGVPAHELTDGTPDAKALGLRWLEPARIVERSGAVARIQAFERVLLQRFSAIGASDARVAQAVCALSLPAPPSIAELARDVGWSRQQLARAFRRQVGVSPKQFARTARLQRAVDRLQSAEATDLASTALELGYSDQAHMCRDFRELAGVTPREATAANGSFFPIRSLFGSLPSAACPPPPIAMRRTFTTPSTTSSSP